MDLVILKLDQICQKITTFKGVSDPKIPKNFCPFPSSYISYTLGVHSDIKTLIHKFSKEIVMLYAV